MEMYKAEPSKRVRVLILSPIVKDRKGEYTEHFEDLILFYEHFHAETSHGIGASHQTGWTGLAAVL